MHFVSHPVNLEPANKNAALRASVALAGVPAGASLRVFAARTPDALTPSVLASLASNGLSLTSLADRTQAGATSGLREAKDVEVAGSKVEFRLYESEWDLALAGVPNPASWDTTYAPSKERSDGPWYLSVVATVNRVSTLARGGLGQFAGQEHLAAVWLAPSDLDLFNLISDYALGLVRSFKPVVDSRLAQFGVSLDAVELGDHLKGDWKLAAFLTPERVAEAPNGISAPDRREQVPAMTIRLVSYSDDPTTQYRVLQQAAGTIGRLLNTRKHREWTLPDGNILSLAFVSDYAYGRTEEDYRLAVDLTWSAKVTVIGLY